MILLLFLQTNNFIIINNFYLDFNGIFQADDQQQQQQQKEQQTLTIKSITTPEVTNLNYFIT